MILNDNCEAQAKENEMRCQRLKLRGALCGSRYALPAIGGPQDDWTVPTDKVRIEAIIGSHLLRLKQCCCGNHLLPEIICSCCKLQVEHTASACHLRQWQLPSVKCRHCNQRAKTVVSEAPVNAVVDHHSQIRIQGSLEDDNLADKDNVVIVTFGRPWIRPLDPTTKHTSATPRSCSTQ